MAGENFCEQLTQLLLAGAAPLASSASDEATQGSGKDRDVATADDEPAAPLLPGLSLLIQQMTNLVDEPVDASADAAAGASVIDGGAPSVPIDLLEAFAVSTSTHDDTASGASAVAALNLPAQPQSQPPAPAPPASSGPAAAASMPIDASHSGRLADSLDEQITWLADAARKGGPQQATISLHPAEWGSLQIRVDLAQDGQTTVKFDCETPQARHAIESSLGQLRELLSATVVTGAAPRFELGGGFGHPQSDRWKPGPQATDAPDDGKPAERVSTLRHPLGLLDQFA